MLPSLPQNDPRAKARADELAETRAKYEYAYDSHATPSAHAGGWGPSPPRPMRAPMSGAGDDDADMAAPFDMFASTSAPGGAGANDAAATTQRASMGPVWSFKYFLYSRRLKRVVFFTCKAVSKHALAMALRRVSSPRNNNASASEDDLPMDEEDFEMDL